jgi:hypothetical protein
MTRAIVLPLAFNAAWIGWQRISRLLCECGSRTGHENEV